jgi:hypothetical protein
MRIVFLLPLAVGVAVTAGCGSEARERDLTLQKQSVGVAVASPAELERPTQTRAVRSTRRVPTPPRPTPIPPKPVIETVVPAIPISTASAPANDRELTPGETVTLIPAGNGPSTAVDETGEYPKARARPIVVRGGDICPPQGLGPGIGITVFPRPRFR